MPKSGNLLDGVGGKLQAEVFDELMSSPSVKFERIVSMGQATPPGQWYDQPWIEWVFVISGAARLRIEGEDAARELKPGDYIELPAHCRHRVEWTHPDEPTVWLAVHVKG